MEDRKKNKEELWGERDRNKYKLKKIFNSISL
jgi:hypothetical protein